MDQTINIERRNELQSKFANMWLAKRWGILLLTPRFGKIYTSINIMNQLPKDIEVLIAYPDRVIKQSWKDDFEIRKFDDSNVTYTTHMSIKKHMDKKFGLVIIDEIHLLSPAQRVACERLFMINREVLALTGTLMEKTEKIVYKELGLRVIAEYTLAEAIEDKIVPDYHIEILYVPLDNEITGNYNKRDRTDKSQARAITWVINKMDRERRNANFMRLQRTRIFQNSISKIKATKQVLRDANGARILVFCGLVAVAESLGIPTHHGKSTDKELFLDFVSGKVNQMAVVKIGGSGVTYKKLNRILINSFDSNAERLAQKINRAMSMEYDNPEKRAEILILTSDDKIELNWLKKALEFFDKNKIIYLNKN